MNRAGSATSDLRRDVRRLSLAIESLEDNLDEVGRSALGAAGGITTFGVSTEGAGFAVRGLSASIIASLVPALAALSAALVPIIGALGGFAAVAGAIGGFGIAGVFAAITTHGKQLKQQVKGIAATLRSAFAPAIERAVTVISALLSDFEQIIPQLVPAEETIRVLGNQFYGLGAAIIDVLPAFVSLAETLATEFLPPFVQWVQAILPRVPALIRALVSNFRRLLPQFMEAGRLIMRLLPPLNEFGFTVLNVLGPALADLARAGTQVLQFFNRLDARIQKTGAAVAVLAPVIVGLASILTGPLAAGLAVVGGAVAALALAVKTNFANIRDYFSGLWTLAQRAFKGIQSAFQAIVAGMDWGAITAAVNRFEAVLGAQLMKTLKALRPVVSNFVAMLRENKQEFRIIGGAVSDLVVAFINWATIIMEAVYPALRLFLIPTLNAIVDTIGVVIDSIATAIQAARELGKGDIRAAAEIATGLDVNHELQPPAPGQPAAGGGGGQPVVQNDFTVRVEGELPREAIRDVSVEQEQRQTRMRQGRQPSPR